MSSRTWVYVIILIIVLAAGGLFFWWMYKTSKITPKAEVTPTPTPQTFTDVEPIYWAFTEIEAVYKAGYMIGWREFKPDEMAKRSTMAVAVAKSYNKSYDNPTPTFSDVPTTHWAYKEIEGLVQAGWLEGYPDGTFKPDDNADRATVAVVVARAYANGEANIPGGPATPSFSDVPTTHWAYKHIEYLHSENIMNGYPDGTFKPDNFSDRATLAVAVARAKTNSNVPDPPTIPTFSDVPTTHWAYKEIEYVEQIEVMIGYPLFFLPDNYADRASVAVAIARAVAGGEASVPAGPATPSYSDVPTDHWAYKHIEYVKTQDPPIMEGYEDGTFRPDYPPEYAARFTIAVVLARAKSLDLSNPPAEATFADVATTDPYFKEVEAIYKAGYTQGCGTDPATGKLNFCPTNNLSRAALAVFIYNAYLKPAVVSPSPQPSTPVPTPSTPTPQPSASVTVTPTPTPTETLTATPTPTTTTGTGTGTGTGTAKTGPEIPLVGGGLLGLLFLVRYFVGRKIK